MLLLEIDSDTGLLIQGFVKSRWPARAQLDTAQTQWARMFARSAALWSQMDILSAAIRISASPHQPLEVLHSFLVSKSEEQRLRLALAAFLRNDQIGGASATAPLRESDLANAFFHPHEIRVGLRYDALRTQYGHSIVYDLRLLDYLPRILQTVVDLGLSVSYEAQVAPWTPPREFLRSSLHDISRLQELPTIPATLAAAQRRLFDQLKRLAHQRSYYLEECLATAQEADVASLSYAVTAILANSAYALPGQPFGLQRIDNEFAETFAHHVHSHVMFGALDDYGCDAAAAALPLDEVDRLLSCQMLGIEPGLEHEYTAPPAGPQVPPSTAPNIAPAHITMPSGGTPNHGAGKDPFVFISYARANKEIVESICESLQRSGVAIWMDKRLIGGDDWVSELETQLINCHGVLAIVSQAFSNSKYCAREVMFADALGKPLIPLIIEPSELKGGLAFILHSIQQIPFAGPSAVKTVISAIAKHAPEACAESWFAGLE